MPLKNKPPIRENDHQMFFFWICLDFLNFKSYNTMNGKNRPLVIDELVEFENNHLKLRL